MDKNVEIEKRLLFQGGAVAFGAHIRRPEEHIVPSIASCYLPVTGGLAEGSSGPRRIKDIIEFESATTRVPADYADVRRAADFTHGNFHENQLAAHIFVESSLKGLKFLLPQESVGDAAPTTRTFSVDHLYCRQEGSCDRKSPVAFRSLETDFRGVMVDGRRLNVKTSTDMFERYDTYAGLLRAYEEDSDFRKQYSSLFYPTGTEKSGLSGLISKHEIPHSGGTIVGTVVSGLQWDEGLEPPDTVISGNRLDVKGIGTIFFGEIITEPSSRRVTLLRFQLGSPCGGDGSAVETHAMVKLWPTG